MASAVYCNIIQIASAEVPGFSGAMLIFVLLCSAHKCSVLSPNAHYWHHFLTLQHLIFASGFKTRRRWVISLLIAQNLVCEFPHILNFIQAPLLESGEFVRSPAAGAQLWVPSAAHPGSSSSGQGKAAGTLAPCQTPCTSFLLLENRMEESLAEGKSR